MEYNLHISTGNMGPSYPPKDLFDLPGMRDHPFVESLNISTEMLTELVHEDGSVNIVTDAINLAGYTNLENLAPLRQQRIVYSDLAWTEEALKDTGLSFNTVIDDDAAQVLLDETYKSPIYLDKNTFLPSIDHLTTLTTLPVYETQFDNDIRELQEATAAFLADEYVDGSYIATPEDIVDLQEATAAFLADRYDGECFCLDDAPGLLLPGEQFLLPAATAVELARSTCHEAEDMIDMIDDYLLTQMSREDEPETTLLEATLKTAVPKVKYTSFDDLLGPNLLPKTPQLGEHYDDSRLLGQPYVALDDLPDLHRDLHPQPILFEDEDGEHNDDNFSNAATDISDVAFDAPDALSPSQASYAASFFSADTATLVVYTSMDQLLVMDDENDTLPRVHGALTIVDYDDGGEYDEVAELDDEVGDEDSEVLVDLDDFCFDWDEPLETSATQSGKRTPLNVVTKLPTILEEDEPWSAASGSSVDFADKRGFLKMLPVRRENFLEDDGEIQDNDETTPLFADHTTAAGAMDAKVVSASRSLRLNGEVNAPINVTVEEGMLQPVSPCTIEFHDKYDVEQYDDFFTDDIWNDEPELKLVSPVNRAIIPELVAEAELELFEALTSVFDAVRCRSWMDVPIFDADLQKKLLSLMEVFRGLGLLVH